MEKQKEKVKTAVAIAYEPGEEEMCIRDSPQTVSRTCGKT